jgi:alanine racemase
MEIKSKIIKLNTVEKGETVGYSRTYTAKEKLQTAIIPVGYADGYFRSLSNRGRVLINGEYCDILGRISMDQMTVDVTGKNVAYDDEVVLIGQSNNSFISADELADICGTINYEITSKITSRIRRKYIKGGVIFE